MSVQYIDVMSAHAKILQYLSPTPAHHYPVLDEFIGAQVYIKHENHHAAGAFKVRGGINLLAQMTDAERQRGLIAASTGNHGQSIARAGRLFGAEVKIVVPVGTNLNKIRAIESLDAQVLQQGERFNNAFAYAQKLAEDTGAYFVDNGNEPKLIAGVATATKELLDEVPMLDAIFVPVGSGTLAAGACIVAKTVNPAIRVIAVQSAQAPAAHDSWQSGTNQIRPNQTIAEGLSTGSGFDLPQQVLREYLDDFILVDDALIMQSQVWLLDKAHTLAEGAGAAGLAGIYSLRDQLQGQQVGFICSGGNTSRQELRHAFANYAE